MTAGRKSLFALSLVASMATTGCSDKPHDFGSQQPDIQSLDKRDRGLQSKNVVEASDQMSMDLLAIPQLADSPTQWNVVVTGMENATVNRRQNYDIFINRLRSNLAKQGHGRIQLIENRERYRGTQERELEGEVPRPGPAGVQPQYALHGEVTDLPNRGTDYYLFNFVLTDLRTRVRIWENSYEVRVDR